VFLQFQKPGQYQFHSPEKKEKTETNCGREHEADLAREAIVA
jgi:hypothetical protein